MPTLQLQLVNATRDLGSKLTRGMSMFVPRASMPPVNSESRLTLIGSNTTTEVE